MNIDQYLIHLPTCSTMQNWGEAEQALADTPQQLRSEDWNKAYEEMRTKMKTCTCGLQDIKEELKFLFTIRDLAKNNVSPKI